MSKYIYNKDFFEKIDTEEKAYWLGFLYADGCINRLYRNEKIKAMDLELGLCREDEEHLNKFLKSINSNIPIVQKKNQLKGKTYYSSKIVVCCTKMCRDLISNGCTPQKSLVLKFPDKSIIEDSLIRHFIRGYFDGDGCIYTNSNNKISINFTGTSDMLLGISDFLLQNNIMKTTVKLYDCGKAKEMFIYGIDNIKDILDYLYKDCTIYLERKYNKYIEFYSDYNNENYRGVYFDRQSKKWIANITRNHKRIIIGRFKCVEDAIKERKNVEIELLNAD